LTQDAKLANALARLKDCQGILAEYQGALREGLRLSEQEDDVPAVMLQRAFDFGVRTISAALVLMQDGDRHSVFVSIVCRPFYELSTRLLWATRAPGGWQRLQAYWASEDMKWAREAETMPPLDAHARAVGAARQEVLARTDPGGEVYSPAPVVQQLLQEIQAHDLAEGIQDRGSDAAAFNYANVYRILCRGAHAHMAAIAPEKPEAVVLHAATAVVLATWMLVQAFLHVAAADPKKEIEVVGRRFIEIMRKTQEAGPASSDRPTSENQEKA